MYHRRPIYATLYTVDSVCPPLLGRLAHSFLHLHVLMYTGIQYWADMGILLGIQFINAFLGWCVHACGRRAGMRAGGQV